LKKLVAYITTAYPSLEFTHDLALSLKDAGVDSLELGVPFSDPVAGWGNYRKSKLKSVAKWF